MLHQSWGLKSREIFPICPEEGVYINFISHKEREAYLRGADNYRDEVIKVLKKNLEIANLAKETDTKNYEEHVDLLEDMIKILDKVKIDTNA